MPANLSKKYLEVLRLAKKAHNALGCKGVTRSDFKFFKNNFYFRNKHPTWNDKPFFGT